MTVFTQSGFAKYQGVSRNAVNKLVKSGTLVLNSDNKIDTASPETIAYIKGRGDRAETKAKKKMTFDELGEHERNKATVSTLPQSNVTLPGGIDVDPDDETLASIDTSDLTRLNIDQLDRLHKIEKIKTERIKNAHMRGKLIDSEFAKKMFAENYAIEVNENLQMSASLSPMICDLFKDDTPEKLIQVSKLINDESYKAQAHKKVKLEEFFKTVEKLQTK